MKSIRVRAVTSLATACVLATLAMPLGRAQTYTETVLNSFGGTSGVYPVGGLIEDDQGNLYGTTVEGGPTSCIYNDSDGCGVVFKVSKAGIETVLYNFCSQPYCTDGLIPLGVLIRDAQGNLYGTTENGGDDTGSSIQGAPMIVIPGGGVVFKLSKTGEQTVLHTFTGGVADGVFPAAGLIRDSAGNLYGTTVKGGGTSCDFAGCGTVFKIDAQGNETMLYGFCSQYGCADGAYPVAGLIWHPDGTLYGTTEAGGTGVGPCGVGCGTVFRIDQSSSSVFYNFCSQPGCTDGANPHGGVIEDSARNLYGTTLAGGGTGCGGVGCGTVFKIDEHDEETVLYSFCSLPKCTDGASPVAGLIRDSAGNLYGTTEAGGSGTACTGFACGGGTVFKIDASGKETVLHSFCSQSSCTDGQYPVAGLIRDSAGNLYGTTEFGGTANSGVVFKLAP